MELQRIDTGLDCLPDRIILWIHENANTRDKGRQTPEQPRQVRELHVPWTSLEKHEPERVRSGIDGHEGIITRGDSADLDAHPHCTCAPRAFLGAACCD